MKEIKVGDKVKITDCTKKRHFSESFLTLYEPYVVITNIHEGKYSWVNPRNNNIDYFTVPKLFDHYVSTWREKYGI